MEQGQQANPEILSEAVARLKAGRLVAFPTETVYGLGADALSDEAVARVFAAKGRPAGNPLIVHVSSAAMAQEMVVSQWPEEAEHLARAFWPGPLSLVLPKHHRVPKRVTGGGPSVAVRCPDHPFALALIEAFGSPIVGPSANLSGSLSPTRASDVREVWRGSEVYVIDGGPCRGGIESTVLSLANAAPRILRPGFIGSEAIEAVLGRPVESDGAWTPAEGEPAPAPGILGRHYAPNARALLMDEFAVPTGVDPAGVVLVTHRPPTPEGDVRVVRMPSRAEEYAARLYAALREVDAMHPTLIVVERPPRYGSDSAGTAIWRAIHERLERATGEQGGDRPV
ncbi:MAG: L-threonylcarbamoyladenylate synthase [Phycisphaerales bacterium]